MTSRTFIGMMEKAHAEKLQAARDFVLSAETSLHGAVGPYGLAAIARLIDAKIELMLLERGGG